jgi:hypothetical protein
VSRMFNHLDKLTKAELNGCIAFFTTKRDLYAADGNEGIADIYATVVDALVSERERRRAREKNIEKVYFADGLKDEDVTQWVKG